MRPELRAYMRGGLYGPVTQGSRCARGTTAVLTGRATGVGDAPPNDTSRCRDAGELPNPDTVFPDDAHLSAVRWSEETLIGVALRAQSRTTAGSFCTTGDAMSGRQLAMDSDIEQARRLGTHALGRAAMTADWKQKERWQELAEEWATRVDMLIHGRGPAAPEASPASKYHLVRVKPSRRVTARPSPR
jgi:hypothetical protein